MLHRSLLALAAILLVQGGATADMEPVSLYAAGSLKAALSDVARAYELSSGREVATVFGPSGLLRERIENGEPAHLFASANMAHPRALADTGRGGPVRLFARNKLCAVARPGLAVSAETLLDVMLRPEVRLGTSTPKADPSGDYAWELFARADTIRPGSGERLESKALKLTGGPDSEPAPAGRNTYAWVMDSDKADVFLTYCTNAVLARREVPGLQIVQVSPPLAVGADYGMIVLDGAPPAARSLADFILGPEGQEILASYGFEPAADGS